MVAEEGEGKWSAGSGTFTPLCFIALPRPWIPHCARRQQFKRIREHFYTVADMYHVAGTEACHESTDQRITSGMVDMLVMFGIDCLQELVGEITFFERLPLIMQTWRRGEPSVGAADGHGSPTYLSSPSSASSEPWDNPECLDLLSKWKGPRYETVAVHDVLSLRYADGEDLLIKKEAKQHQLEFISESLSIRLLESIYVFSAEERGEDEYQLVHTDFDMALVRSTIQEVEALQARLETTEDDNEQRALEEDLTGQILWFYWCGICSEVNKRLLKVSQHLYP
ncbi:hypothetical protein EDD17DRAFT_1592285 [Pisolithus thermaeus]|nr:hypothetical protein EDD17DRAFT_1592285 [Pisolithus thermaeus]